MKIGKYKDVGKKGVFMPLTDARQKWQEYKTLVDQDKDPKYEIEQELQAEKERLRRENAAGTIEELIHAYTDDMKSQGKASAKEALRILEYDTYKHIQRSAKAKEIRVEHIKAVISEPLVKRKKLIQANRLRSYLMAAFNFGIKWDNDANRQYETIRFSLTQNPVRDIPKPAKEEPRHRHLTKPELKQFWEALENSECNIKTKQAIKLIYSLGGQRVEEILRLKKSDINWAESYLTLQKTKIGNNHAVPFSGIAESILKELCKQDSNQLFAMPYASLNQAINRIYQREGMKHFTTKDARETVKTLLAKRIPSKTARDRYQNHGIPRDSSQRHYDSHNYLNVTIPVAKAWNKQLSEIIKGEDSKEGDNVVSIIKRA